MTDDHMTILFRSHFGSSHWAQGFRFLKFPPGSQAFLHEDLDIKCAPISSFAFEHPEDAFLTEHDGVAVPVWIISIAMIAATVFFSAEAGTVHTLV